MRGMLALCEEYKNLLPKLDAIITEQNPGITRTITSSHLTFRDDNTATPTTLKIYHRDNSIVDCSGSFRATAMFLGFKNQQE